jgi:hypothetical protein
MIFCAVGQKIFWLRILHGTARNPDVPGSDRCLKNLLFGEIRLARERVGVKLILRQLA